MEGVGLLAMERTTPCIGYRQLSDAAGCRGPGRREGGAVGAGLALGERVLQGQVGVGHAVVLGEDQPLGAVLAEFANLVVLEAPRLRLERLQDVVGVVVRASVEV